MAAPAALVLPPNQLSKVDLGDFKEKILEISDVVEGKDFWIKERPFLYWTGTEYEGALEEYVEQGVQELIGWTPCDVIGFSAMCNGPIDRYLLGQLYIMCMTQFEGVVDFGVDIHVRAGQGYLERVALNGNIWIWSGHSCRLVSSCTIASILPIDHNSRLQ